MKTKAFGIFLLLIVLTFSLAACDSLTSKPKSIEIENDTKSASVGDGLTLSVKDDRGKVVDPVLLLWQSSNYSVASVDANGAIKCISGGPAVITATLKDDMTVSASTEIFVEYNVTAPLSPTFTKTGVYVDAEFGKIGDLLMEFNFDIIDMATATSLPWDIALGFFSSNNYLFSMMYYRGSYQNAVICPLTDWTSSNCQVDTRLLTSDYIHEKMLSELGVEGYQAGGTFEVYSEEIVKLLEGSLPENKTYHFSKMNPDMQYRVVIRGDFDHLTNAAHYSNGLLTALKISIEDIFNKDLASLPSNFYDQKYYDEIANLSNLRICIEYKEVSK